MKTRDKYVSVNGSWPADADTKKPISPALAKRAFKVLYRHRFHKPWKFPVQAVKGAHRRTWAGYVKLPKHIEKWGMIVAPDAGWHNFVHDLSHWIHRKQYPNQDAHRASSHAAVEKDLIEQVVNRGWLQAKEPQRRPRAAKPKPTPAQAKLQRIEASIARWEAKQRRAANALKRLCRQRGRALRYAARVQSAAATEAVVAVHSSP